MKTNIQLRINFLVTIATVVFLSIVLFTSCTKVVDIKVEIMLNESS